MKFSAVAKVHRNGRPTGETWVEENDPSEEIHPLFNEWKVRSIEFWGNFQSWDEAKTFADGLVIVDDTGRTRWGNA